MLETYTSLTLLMMPLLRPPYATDPHVMDGEHSVLCVCVSDPVRTDRSGTGTGNPTLSVGTSISTAS